MAAYKIIKRLGHGTGGTVYLAWHNNLNKYVILKELKLESYSPADIRNEVDVLKNLRHSYLPQVYDFFEQEGKVFLVEEYVDGEDLEHMMERGCVFPEEWLLLWLKQLCQVLQYLHTRKPPIIHSDIKPANIMIDKNGDVCLIDFNIAVCGGQTDFIRGLTRDYAPPEQVELMNAYIMRQKTGGLRLKPSVDIYSLSATFYKLMTGRVPPRDGSGRLEHNKSLNYSVELRRAIDKGLREDVRHRYRSAKEMENVIDRLERLSDRYRFYRILRATISSVGALMILGGCLMIQSGVREKIMSEYRAEYTVIEATYNEYGPNADLSALIERVTGNNKYDSIRDSRASETAQLYAIEAEYYFAQDTNAGYSNAAYYYKLAMDEGGSDTEIHALNYALSLALSGDTVGAERVAGDYLYGTAVRSVSAEILFVEGRYLEVLNLADGTAYSGSDMEAYGQLCRTASAAAQKLKDWQGAIKWYEKLYEINGSQMNIRKLAMLYMNAGGFSENTEYYKRASELYEKLKNPSAEDDTNHALAEYYLEHYSKSLTLLKSAKEKNSSDALMCRGAYYEAMIYLAQNYISSARDACIKGLRYYDSLTDAQKEKIDVEGLFEMAEQFGIKQGG